MKHSLLPWGAKFLSRYFCIKWSKTSFHLTLMLIVKPRSFLSTLTPMEYIELGMQHLKSHCACPPCLSIYLKLWRKKKLSTCQMYWQLTDVNWKAEHCILTNVWWHPHLSELEYKQHHYACYMRKIYLKFET